MLAPGMAGAANPQRDAGRGDPKFERLGGALDGIDSKISPAVQTFDGLGGATNTVVAGLLVHRIAWLARKGRITPDMATALAPLLFGEGCSR